MRRNRLRAVRPGAFGPHVELCLANCHALCRRSRRLAPPDTLARRRHCRKDRALDRTEVGQWHECDLVGLAGRHTHAAQEGRDQLLRMVLVGRLEFE